jgi:hypothetical protein
VLLALVLALLLWWLRLLLPLIECVGLAWSELPAGNMNAISMRIITICKT